MKQLLSILLATVLLAGSFTGCAKSAPAGEPIPETQEAPAQAPEPGALASYQTPARFTGDWTGLEDTFFVHADAEIILPDTDRMPKAAVHPRAITQEEADKLLAVFLKDNPFYQEFAPTKEYLQDGIDRYEAILRGELPYEGDGTIERLPEVIKYWKAQQKLAPRAGEQLPAEKTFHYKEYPEGTRGYTDEWKEIEGYAEVDGRNIHCLLMTPKDPVGNAFTNRAEFWEEGYRDLSSNPNYSQRSPFWFNAVEKPKPVPSFSEAQAEEMADNLLCELGISGFTLDYIEPVTFGGQDLDLPWHKCAHDPTGETGYTMQYVRKVGGGVLTHTGYNGSASEEGNPYPGSWHDEFLSILVTEDRVVYFDWRDPYTEPEILDDNVSLMPFEDIQAIFAKMIFVKNSYWLEAGKISGDLDLFSINVDKVQLTLMRTRPRDSYTDGTIIPVWDFWGTLTAYEDEESYERKEPTGDLHTSYEVQLTINAIDGTVVDRELGY